MTVAEFAEALRVRPVTVRSWIAKGQLRATRGGKRKWLVRRSELARMIERGDGAPVAPPPPARPRIDDGPPAEVYAEMAVEAEAMARERQEQDYGEAAYEWEIALEQSRMAPPDARFPSRIRHIAEAAWRRAAAIRESTHDPEFAWEPVSDTAGMTLSYELRPGGNRPGPRDAWERFDRVVARLGSAMAGTSASAVAQALYDLAGAMWDIADAIDSRPTGARSAEDRPRLDRPSGV